MKKLIALAGIVCLVVGIFESSQTFSFISRALTTQAKVVAVQLRTGPPKPTQNTPVHVTFTLPSGSEHTAITHLPLLQKVKEGDSIYILVNPENPQDVRLPLLSELWARPFAFTLGGLVLLCGVLFVRVREKDVFNSPAASKAGEQG
jgi:hypothetical protein